MVAVVHDQVGLDVIAGDNAAIVRAQSGGAYVTDDFAPDTLGVVRRIVTLYDVATTAVAAPAGTSGGDTLFGETGDDTLYGEGGADLLYGNADADTLFGGGDGVCYAFEALSGVPAKSDAPQRPARRSAHRVPAWRLAYPPCGSG